MPWDEDTSTIENFSHPSVRIFASIGGMRTIKLMHSPILTDFDQPTQSEIVLVADDDGWNAIDSGSAANVAASSAGQALDMLLDRLQMNG